MTTKKLFIFLLPVIAVAGLMLVNACKNANTKNTGTKTDSTNTGTNPAAVNAGLTLPAGFSAAAIVENLSSPRHLAVTPQNDIYVHLSGSNNGKGILVFHDEGDKATLKTGFANYGGTGIAIKNGYLYASSNSDIYRYKLNDKNEVIDPAKPETIVTGLTNKRMHNSKSIVLDNDGYIYVNIGAYSNICEEYDKDKKGCPVLADAAGIWQFKADKLNQKQSDGIRYATGLRNVVGLDWNQQDNQLFVMQQWSRCLA